MRRTSDRRKEPTRTRYAGDPGEPIPDRGTGALVADDDEPSAWCAVCRLPIKVTPAGRMRAHAEGGHGTNLRAGHPPCQGCLMWHDPVPIDELRAVSVATAQADRLVTQRQMGRAFDWSPSETKSMSRRSWFPRPVARLDGAGGAHLWDACVVVAQMEMAVAEGWVSTPEEKAEQEARGLRAARRLREAAEQELERTLTEGAAHYNRQVAAAAGWLDRRKK